MDKIIGIDLGTTNSCVAVMEGGQPTVITNAEGLRTTPSIVAFTGKGECLVGESAKRQAVTNPEKTITSIKRQMGSKKKLKIGFQKYTPPEISALILQKLKRDAEAYLGMKVEKAVITVPAYFDDTRRQATSEAGKIAGLEVVRIINEPTAAALAYGLGNGEEQLVMVYDLGGGTFDVSIIQIADGCIEVLATAGDNHLGGDDFDERLAEYMVQDFMQKEDIDLSKDVVAMRRIREEAEKAKRELSAAESVTVNLPFISMKDGGKHLECTLTRSLFNRLTYDLVNRTEAPVKAAVEDAGIAFEEIDRVLLAGGASRIPAVQEKVRKLTGKQPSLNLNPDECVALGAAVQAGKLAGEPGLNEVLLLDVTPFSLSIETEGGFSTFLVDRNTTIPTKCSHMVTTAANFQTAVDIKVLQGEEPMAKDNKLIGKFRLGGIRLAKKGEPAIEVVFDIDASGILNVSARDIDTGKSQSITIMDGAGLSERDED